ncbi:hypothetical protein PTTG_00454 [Puccinia triticina 1-1 BBBD Race 1]|uniref:Uncharacterized protein n=2 Tax=Puccinia triticina TaxID=208348 RepID=A0A0C4EI88_PUCT1|nr:uncharacterized protein PtA15_2A597 [Puccinia triticina]OAV99788.1 hypothetical protein PTTG_00454 [Puccinia triticina 1-1 BBBD Race 1]WAQ82280.1 hypothetical protein PtA15_2A597 [Puccinia triticina]WAR53134.1 hypothetical protein PtB15_2B565 [Puccinia triticina]
MVQGFKSKKTTTTPKNNRHKAQLVKKGGRVVPPNKPAAVTQKMRKEKVSKSVTGEIEQMVVSKSVGKLTIMKHLKEAEKTSSSKTTK